MNRRVSLSALFVSVGVTATFLVARPSFAGQPQGNQDPRIANIPLQKNLLRGPKFLATDRILDAFKAKKVVVTGKKLSSPQVFTPRRVYASDSLYVECDRIATSSAIANEWHLIHHNGFYVVNNSTAHKPFIVTLSGFTGGRLVARVTTRTSHGTMSPVETAFDYSMSGDTEVPFTLPVIVSDPDDVSTVRYWFTEGSPRVTGIEVRTLD